MKTILFTGSHRLLLAEEIFKQYGRSYFDNLSYYFYLLDNVGNEFIINGKAIKVDIDKILTLISITDNPLDVISQYISIEN